MFFAAAGTLLGAATADAKVYELKAASKLVTMPDGVTVQMWGFGLASDAEVSIPGPALEVPPGDDTLTIQLTNNLTVPVSIVIPGQLAATTPVWNDGTAGPRTSLGQRVFSLAQAAAPGATATYQWSGLKPGTYLYHSGTLPAVQVPMGLYGALTHDAAAGTAYPGVTYDVDALLLYSEVDPLLNAAVAGGSYGTPAYPSTVDYRAQYFLINGTPFQAGAPLPATVNKRLLLRLLNAGLQSIVPALQGEYMRLIAEDGQPYAFAPRRYSMLLAAGKTRDAIVQPATAGALRLFDRALRLVDPAGSGAALIAQLDVSAAQGAPTALGDAYAVDEDGVLDTAQGGLSDVLANDSGTGLSAVLVANAGSGSLTLAADGSFVYQPAPNFAGSDVFSYYAFDGSTASAAATVTITVNPINDAPLAADDALHGHAGMPLLINAPGLLANDSDLDGDALQAEVVLGPAAGTVNLTPDGALEYTPAAGTTSDSFSYRVFDGTAYSAPATVGIMLHVPMNAAPIAEPDSATTRRNTAVTINVAANDSDPDGTLVPGSVVLVDPPSRGGTVVNLHDGRVEFTPKRNFLGTDTFTYAVFDDQGARSGAVKVSVNVIK